MAATAPLHSGFRVVGGLSEVSKRRWPGSRRKQELSSTLSTTTKADARFGQSAEGGAESGRVLVLGAGLML